jgi:hypothetical protein
MSGDPAINTEVTQVTRWLAVGPTTRNHELHVAAGTRRRLTLAHLHSLVARKAVSDICWTPSTTLRMDGGIHTISLRRSSRCRRGKIPCALSPQHRDPRPGSRHGERQIREFSIFALDFANP